MAQIFVLLTFILTSLGTHAAACGSERLTMNDQNFQVKVIRYLGNSPSSRAILILPPTGGTNLIDRSYARRFCYNGFNVFIVDRWSNDTYQSDELELHQRLYTQAAHAVGTVLQNIPHKFIGLMGTSVGALYATVAAGTFDRIDAVMTIVGGSTIPGVIVGSDQKAMVDLKARRYAKYGFKSDVEYLARLDAAFSLDTTELPPKFKKMDLATVIATEDLTVRTENQYSLRNYWKPSKVIEISAGHFWGIVYSWLFHSREITQFFKASADQRLNKN